MIELAQELVTLLKEQGLHIATAESCTGGMVSAAITAVSGASEVFDGSVVSYANRIKHKTLGVPEEILLTVGAVSEECACAMAQGVRELMGADLGLSLTGIAGPGGGTPDKPVGTVFLGISTPRATYARRLSLSGGRDKIRRDSVEEALSTAISEISNF